MRGKAARRALVVIVISFENNDPVPLPARIPSRRMQRRHPPACVIVGVLWKKIQPRVFSFESGQAGGHSEPVSQLRPLRILIATCELESARDCVAHRFQSPCDDADRGASLQR